jgi:predicted RNA-binding Zn-ribbon protein involved in translation (DUF1610 family)
VHRNHDQMAAARKGVQVYEHPSSIPRAVSSDSDSETTDADSDALSLHRRSAVPHHAPHRAVSPTIPLHPVTALDDEARSMRVRRHVRRDRGVCVSCGIAVQATEKVAKLSCVAGSVIHVRCIRCPCDECVCVRDPVTKNPAVPASAYSLWPFTLQLPVTTEDVSRFVERNRSLLVKPVHDHPSGTATAKAASFIAVL